MKLTHNLLSKKKNLMRAFVWVLTFFLSAGVLHAREKDAARAVIPLWPAGTAQVAPAIPEERVPRDFEVVKNIHNPNLTVFRAEKPNGAAVVICPGGGYGIIATGLEGYPIAERLNQAGVTAFVLKYRLPTTTDADFKHPIPLSDALRAIQLVRHRAEEFDIDPGRIGIMGFSAGGHLAASAGTLYSKYNSGSDKISRVSSRPDFMCLAYPVISAREDIAHGCVRSPLKPGFSPDQLAEMSCELNVNPQTPPTFLLHAKDDKGVLPQNSIVMHEALNEHGVPTALKLYEKGGHGFGLGRKGTDSVQWPGDFISWLRNRRIIPGEPEFYTPKRDLAGLKAKPAIQAGLPNVLIIGDSISIGYTKPVIELMQDAANVQRVKANCGDTRSGQKNLKKWLGDTQWDVIHFNWGLHDLCYRHPDSKVQGRRDKVNGTQAVPLDQYEKNLEALVLQLKETGATLIWASTTMVPAGEAGRVVGDDLKYNAVAAKIMQKHGIAINDLHALTAGFDPALFLGSGDVHFKKKGSAKLARQVATVIARSLPVATQETLPPMTHGVAAQTVDEMWAGFDPRAEPLEVEVLKEWEEDGVVLRVLRYRIGVFKGQKAMMAGVYGYPKGAKHLPGLVQLHGGGQYADYRAVLSNAKRGYATISVSWAGRIAAPGYGVNPDVVKLFWENKTDDPNYKLITDWGALDAYHAPSRNPGNHFPSVYPADWRLDPVDSPRNSPWFLCTLGARRALTFLEQQPEVDADRLGVYGHSMGGKLTVMTAGSDDRVKAAAPSCGGISDRDNKIALYEETIGDDVFLKRISCPIIFLSPANDFHGRIDDLQTAVKEIKSSEWRVTCAAHHNHQDTADYEVATQLWFDQHLKGTFRTPQTPGRALALDTEDGVPVFTVTPDESRPIVSVDIFYTRHGQMDGEQDDGGNTNARFWHHAPATKNGDAWTADLHLSNVKQPLWVYANIVYELDAPVTGAGYYYRTYTTRQFNLSSLMEMVTPADLNAAGVRATLSPSLMIETFQGDWEKEWFTYRPADWARTTHKVYDPQWAAPDGAQLSLDVRAAEANKLVIGIDQYAAEVALSGGSDWQNITLSASDFKDGAEAVMPGWAGIKELQLVAINNLKANARGDKATRRVGAPWKGAPPEFRNLRWLSK